MRFGIDSALVLVCCCGLLCTHLRDPVPRFRRHPFSDYGLASVCVCLWGTDGLQYLSVLLFIHASLLEPGGPGESHDSSIGVAI